MIAMRALKIAGLGTLLAAANCAAPTSDRAAPGPDISGVTAGTTGVASGGSAGTTGGESSAGTGGIVAGAPGAGGAGGAPASAGVSGGGSSGSAGSAGNGGASGASAASGASGTSGAGGTSGTGGSGPDPLCASAPIPDKTTWAALASSYSGAGATCTNDPFDVLCNKPEYAVDADTGTRFATGKKQAGDEWLQIDFLVSTAISQVTMYSSSESDYARHYEIRVSDTTQDFAAPVLVEGDGNSGTINADFAASKGRYLLISQTGVIASCSPTPTPGCGTNWWSIHDLNLKCE